VQLDGASSTDVDGGRLGYRWAPILVPAGSAAELHSARAIRTSFVAGLPGTYVARLIVGDDVEFSWPDTVVPGTDEAAPVANARPDQTGASGSVLLDGGGSVDFDYELRSYRWAVLGLNGDENNELSLRSLDHERAISPRVRHKLRRCPTPRGEPNTRPSFRCSPARCQ